MPVPGEHSKQRPVAGRWTSRQRDWGVVLWISFLSACVGTFGLFALIDPEQLTDAWVPGWQLGLKMVYGLGFVLMFVVSLLSSCLTVFMLRTGPSEGHAQRPPPVIRDPAELNPDLEGEKWQ
jgi:hypothetical protein